MYTHDFLKMQGKVHLTRQKINSYSMCISYKKYIF